MSNFEQPERFPREVEQILRSAGWFPGRKDGLASVTLPPGVPVLLTALSVLEEFGGLVWGEYATGVDMARSKVTVDPLLPGLSARRAEAASAALGVAIYPLGEICDTPTLVIDEQGRIYALTDELWPIAPSFDKAILAYALGKKRPPSELASADMRNVPVPF